MMSQKIKLTDNKELAAFQQLEMCVEDLKLDSDTLIRFLRARDLDVNKAEEMIRHNIRWRVENKISEYLHWTPLSALFTNSAPMVCTGLDNEGSPVIYAPMGKWTTRERLELGLRADCEAFQYFALENIMYHIRNSKSSQMVFILDQAELSYWKCAHLESAQLVLGSFKLFEQHYPEILKKSVVMNSSWLFTLCFNFLKPAFTKKTLSKLQVFNSTDDLKCKKALLELMPPESLPSCYQNNSNFSNNSKYPIVFEF